MEWTDRGLVIQRRRHGENAAIVTVFTREHGRHPGLVRGGAGRRGGGLYQPGNLVDVRWRARLAEHLGTFSGELAEGLAARVLDQPLRLAALVAACALLETTLPEREAHHVLYAASVELLRGLGRDDWAAEYVRWEVLCLAELGFGLDLVSCAATGVRDDLVFVSPRTGRALSAKAGQHLAERLLRLPAFLRDGASRGSPAPPDAVLDGLILTGHFLERHVLAPHHRHLPAARIRLVDRWRRSATISSATRNGAK